MKWPHKRISAILQKGLWGIIIAVLGALWILVITFSDTYRQRIADSSTEELVQMNGMVAQHTAALFKTMQTDLYMIDHWLQDYRGSDPLNDPRLKALLDDLQRLSGMPIDINLISEDGRLYPIPNPDHQPGADVRDRNYYLAQRGNGPRQIFFAEPIVRRTDGKWVLPISWRLESPVNGLTAIVAAIELNQLAEPHERWRFKKEGSILLVRNDGVLLSRAPVDVAMLGRDISAMPIFAQLHDRQQGTFVTDSEATDGIKRLGSFERVDGVPVSVVVTRGYEEAFGSYFRNRKLIVWGVAELTLLVIVFALLIHRTQRSLLNTQQELHRLAMVDELTQVMNRRAFTEQAVREFSRAQRQGESLSVLILDLDFFKKINDTFGHSTGDSVLSNSARLWSDTLRGHDLIGRLGGEEFCVLLPETGPVAALEVAERLRKHTEVQVIDNAKGSRQVTVSIGLATLSESDRNWQGLLDRADHALYAAKQNGRNRVETA